MALPARLLAQLPPGVFHGVHGLGAANAPAQAGALSLGPALDAVLPDGGLPRGAVVEVAASAGAALGTRVALAACRAAQAEGRLHGGDAPWCAFVDPGGSLYAPGVVQAGVELERLLVVRPPLEALARVAARLVESQAFAVVVVDTAGVPGAGVSVALGSWARVVRRLSLALESTSGVALLLTDQGARRPLPLPVALRLELARLAPDRLALRVAKDRHGRVAPVRHVAWPARPRSTRPEREVDHVRRIA